MDNKRYEQLSEIANEFIFEYDYQLDILKLSQKCASMFGLPREMKIRDAGISAEVLKKLDEIETYSLEVSQDPGSVSKEIELHVATGEKRWFRVMSSAILDINRKPLYLVGKVMDIQEQREEKKALLEQSKQDGLTKVLNSGASRDTIIEILQKLDESDSGGFLIMDVDYFKNINDTLGHYIGDCVLMAVADCLVHMSSHDDIIGRLGGDEFILCIKGVKTREDLETVCEKYRNQLRNLSDILAVDHKITVSIGATLLRPGEPFDELYQRADSALYQAKDLGRDRYQIQIS